LFRDVELLNSTYNITKLVGFKPTFALRPKIDSRSPQ